MIISPFYAVYNAVAVILCAHRGKYIINTKKVAAKNSALAHWYAAPSEKLINEFKDLSMRNMQ
jgi:hypothetical protein